MDVNILGFGVMGRQIASLCVLMGVNVFLWNRSDSPTRQQLFTKQLRTDQKFFKGYCKTEGTFTFVTGIDQLKERLTIEVLVEDIDIKRKVISQLGYAFERRPLVTNSSSYSPIEIHPNTIGIHFFNPIYALRFVEFSADGSHLTSEVEEFLSFLIAFDFEIVRTSNNRGYIGNFLLFNEISNALKLIDRYGYRSRTIDAVLRHMGREVSVFDIIDQVGVDVTKKILENLREVDGSIEVSPLLLSAISKNIYGKKNRTSIRQVIDSNLNPSPTLS